MPISPSFSEHGGPMRVGDCGVEVVPVDGGSIRELASGHVLARPGQVYALRLRNHGPLRGVADVRIDGTLVTAGGLVLDPWRTVELERPIHSSEHGRFTVIAEGNERVFGPDGGRDNPDLGLIEVRFRRELPVPLRPSSPPNWTPSVRRFDPERTPTPPSRPVAMASRLDASAVMLDRARAVEPSPPTTMAPTIAPTEVGEMIERAAGTGLTGHSGQEFRKITSARSRRKRRYSVFGSSSVSRRRIEAPRPLPTEDVEAYRPVRPSARP